VIDFDQRLQDTHVGARWQYQPEFTYSVSVIIKAIISQLPLQDYATYNIF
jgi:hypothetical protein